MSIKSHYPTYFDTNKITCAHVNEQVDSVLTAATRTLLVEVPWRRQFLYSFFHLFSPFDCYLRISYHTFCYISWLTILIYFHYIYTYIDTTYGYHICIYIYIYIMYMTIVLHHILDILVLYSCWLKWEETPRKNQQILASKIM